LPLRDAQRENRRIEGHEENFEVIGSRGERESSLGRVTIAPRGPALAKEGLSTALDLVRGFSARWAGRPPVCKIMDYGQSSKDQKFKVREEGRRRKRKRRRKKRQTVAV